MHPFTRKGWSEGGKKEQESERARFSSPQATVINLHPVRLWLKRCTRAKATHALFSSESVLLTPSWSNIFAGSWRSIRQCLFQIKLEEVWQSVAYGRGGAGYLFVACCHASCLHLIVLTQHSSPPERQKEQAGLNTSTQTLIHLFGGCRCSSNRM